MAQQPDTAWEQRLHGRHDQLVQENGPGINPELTTKLEAMAAEDQAARGIVNGKPTSTAKVELPANLAQIDARLTSELKDIVAANGWPTIHLVGIKASNGAMLILIHSADHAWQRSLLPQLEQLAQDDKIDGSSLAMMVDKELIAAGKLQRYGTQFKFVDGQAMMYAVEDPSHLADRRAQAMLPPLDVYKQLLGNMYHVPVSDVIIRPDAPATPPQ
jgi:hypothetical protein